MRQYYSDKEIAELLKQTTIVVDTKEKVNDHITGYFKKRNIPHINRSLTTADYSAMIGDMTLEHDILTERKANIDEIAGNFTVDRKRFENEFLRAKAEGCKVFLIIENCSWSDILLHNYRSKLLPKSLIASLLSWQVRYNISIIFCKPSETGQIIYGILYYAAREALKSGTLDI
ncbi:MAG: ERCC4 domain-containing protein [Candidatus Gastranaerophilales bacterium]|nr:ERCC4 domain-containing protein [Candidatus Gastranaerophilales bacterium]